MLILARFILLLVCTFIGWSVYGETIPSIQIINYRNDLAYIINSPKVVVGLNYQ